MGGQRAHFPLDGEFSFVFFFTLLGRERRVERRFGRWTFSATAKQKMKRRSGWRLAADEEKSIGRKQVAMVVVGVVAGRIRPMAAPIRSDGCASEPPAGRRTRTRRRCRRVDDQRRRRGIEPLALAGTRTLHQWSFTLVDRPSPLIRMQRVTQNLTALQLRLDCQFRSICQSLEPRQRTDFHGVFDR